MKQRIIASIAILLLVLTALPAYAMEPCSVEMSVTVTGVGSVVRVEPVDGAPALSPEEYAVDGTITIPFSFTEPGDFAYRVFQVKEKTDADEIDETVYIARFYIEENGGDAPEAALFFYREGEEEKIDACAFANKKGEEPPPEKPPVKEEPPKKTKTGDDTYADLWAILCMTSAAAVVVLSAVRRRLR